MNPSNKSSSKEDREANDRVSSPSPSQSPQPRNRRRSSGTGYEPLKATAKYEKSGTRSSRRSNSSSMISGSSRSGSRTVSHSRSPRSSRSRSPHSQSQSQSQSRSTIGGAPPRRRRRNSSSESSRSSDRSRRTSNGNERLAGRFTSICVKNLNPRLSNDQLYESLYREFRRCGQFNVKIVNNKKSSPSQDDRIAFVNFYTHDEAREAKRTKMNQIVCGYAMYIEPVFKNHRGGNGGGRSPSSSTSPPPLHHRARSPPSYHRHHSPSPPLPPPPSSRHHMRRASPPLPPPSSSMPRSRSRDRLRRSPPSPPNRYRHRSPSGDPRHSSSRGPGGPSYPSPPSRASSGSYYAPPPPGHHHRQSPAPPPPGYQHRRTPPLPPPPSSSQHMHMHHHHHRSSHHSDYRMPPQMAGPPSHHHHHGGSGRMIHPPPHSPSPPPPPVRYMNNAHRGGQRSMSPLAPSPLHPSQHSHHHHHHHRHDSRSGMHDTRHHPYGVPPPPVASHNRRRSTSPLDLAFQLLRPSRSRSRSPSRGGPGGPYRRPLSPPSRYAPPPPAAQGGVSHYYDDDERDATRTLFVGNLDQDVDKEELMKIFEVFGDLEDIDIKRNMQPSSAFVHPISKPNGDNVRKTYAFVKFCTMDVAIEAKGKMNGQLIRSHEIKIGYGKPQPTRCLWIGGLTEQTRQKDLEETLERVLSSSSLVSKSNIDIIWVSSSAASRKRERCALIELDATRQAEFVRSELRGRREYADAVLARERMVLDFVEPRYVDSVRRRLADKKERSAAVNGAESSDKESGEKSESKKARRVIEESTSESESESTTKAGGDSASKNPGEPVIRVSADSNNERVQEDKKRGGSGGSGEYEKILITTSLDSSLNRRRVDAVVSSTDMVLSNGSSSSTTMARDENVSSTAAASSSSSSSRNSNSELQLPKGDLASAPSPLSSSSTSSLPPVLVTAPQSRIISLKPKDKRSDAPPTTNGTSSSGSANSQAKLNDEPKASASSSSLSSSSSPSKSKSSSEATSEVKSSPQQSTSTTPDSSVKKPTTETPTTPTTTAAAATKSQKPSPSTTKPTPEEVVKQQASSTKSSSTKPTPDTATPTTVTKPAATTKKTEEGNEEGEIVDSPQPVPAPPQPPQPQSLAVQDSRIPKRTAASQIRTVVELGRALTDNQVWSGVFTLKKNVFPSRFFLLAGNDKFAANVLPAALGSQLPNLHINQRIRLDSSKLEDIERKLLGTNQTAATPTPPLSSTAPSANPNSSSIIDTYSVLLSLPASDIGGAESHLQRTMNNLISYLDQKQAAGVISLPDDTRPLANLNIFTPNSSFSKKLLAQLAPSIPITATASDDVNPTSSTSSMSSSSSILASSSDINYLILVLLKNNT